MSIIARIAGWFGSRASIQQVNKLLGTGKGTYAAANQNRLNWMKTPVTKENEVPSSRLEFLRAQSWDLYRDNPSCRKIIRSLEAKVIGPGMNPESLAVNVDGTPHVEFRARAKQLWESLRSGFDSRGLPGKGGLTMAGQQKMALRSTILSGDTLYRIKPINAREQLKRDIPIANTLQLIDTCRLADMSEVPGNELASGNTVFRGIELDADNLRVAYWVKSLPIDSSSLTPSTVTRVPVEKIGHLYLEEDIDQLRGVPWFSSAILRAKRTEDLEYNVLVASAMAACVVATYSKPTGAVRVGLNSSSDVSDGSDLTDTDGNAITKIQPGMIANVGKDGKFELSSPNQPNMNPEAFVQHLQRGTATAVPGIKASTITGDYRNSSFSSERSADNDVWPELKDVQEWFASSYCQPVWETILRSAMQEGYFDDVLSFEEFQASPGRFSAANWQGPVALSINPKDDAAAASARISGGLSSLQMECAKINVNWRDVLNDVAELYVVAKEKGIPPEVINNIMGVDAQDQIAAQVITKANSNEDDAEDPADTEKETADAT